MFSGNLHGHAGPVLVSLQWPKQLRKGVGSSGAGGSQPATDKGSPELSRSGLAMDMPYPCKLHKGREEWNKVEPTTSPLDQASLPALGRAHVGGQRLPPAPSLAQGPRELHTLKNPIKGACAGALR